MRTIDNFKFHPVSRLLAVICVALAISAPFAAAYVATGQSGAQTEQTGSQVDRSKKDDPCALRLGKSPLKEIERNRSRRASIVDRLKETSARQQQLAELMRRANEGTGGFIVNAVTYQDEIDTARANIRKLRKAAEAKKRCTISQASAAQ